MGSVQRRKSLAHLSNLKQERNESIKKYLARFRKEVAQIEDASDVAVIAAFTNGLQSGRLSFDLRRKRPKTYEEMMEIAGDYALAEEEEVAQGGSYVHGHKPDSKPDHKDDKKTQPRDRQRDEKGQKGYPREGRGNARANKFRGRYNHYTPLTGDQEEILSVVKDKGLAKYPRQQSANARRDTTKYCRFHKDHGHDTSKCFQLRDHIESLIRDGHLKDFALKGDKHGGCQDSRQGNGQERKSPRRNSPNATINTIFSGPHTGRSNRERMSEVREVMYESRSMEINSVQRNPKKGREGHDPITFTAEDSDGIDAKPNDAIVVGVRIAHRDVLRVMIDNGSSSDILSARVYDELRLDRKDLEPFHVPLKGFGGAEVRSLGTVKLPVRFGTAPCRRTILLDFVVVDIHNWPYNALLGRPFLNKARAVTSTHALKIKFPTEFGVGELRGSQEMARRANLSIFKDKAGMETLSIFEVDREVQEDNPKNFELDPRDKTSTEKEEPTESVVLDEAEPDKTVKIRARLTKQVKKDVTSLLKEYKGIFAWCHEDMPGIDRSVISYNLAVNEKCKPVVQKRRSFNPERSAAIKEEVSKLLAARSIREVKYPEWVANVVLVKKKNNQWRMCVDFTDLNKACPKDSFPLPRIDQLVDATAGHETLSFMDAYSRYNQIKMHRPDEEKIAFTTDQGLYCYIVMPFGLKNAGATYQRLVNKMFARQIGRNMEVYVDDMLTKSITANRHTDDLRETFDVLVRYGMKLNPAKCVFGVPSGRFLGYQVHQRGIEVNPEKIQALAKMVSPRTLKDVQKLTGCLASLSRFIAKSTDRCLPFFKALKKGKGVEWNEDCEKAFQALKDYLGQAPLLSKPETGETLYKYLSVSKAATSSVLVRQEEEIQKPIYYTSKALLPAETRYSPAEKMALALITAARKLRPYFQAHKIGVYTNCPLKLILQKPEVSGRLTKWAIELSEFDVEYLPRTAIKAQAVADFVAEFTEPSIEVARMMVEQNKKVFKWQLRVDGSSNTHGSGAGVVVSTPEGDSVECALRFDFKATNNQVEYEALIAGLKVCTVLGADEIEIFSDSQVVVNQVLDEYQARDESMITYLELAKELLGRFKEYRIVHVPRKENEQADALAKLASSTINIWPKSISMIRLLQLSIVRSKEVGAVFGERNSWITPIKEYLVNDVLPSDPLEAKRLKYKATRYSVLNGELYKRGYSRALQRCVGPEKAEGILRSIHSGNCGNHAGGASLAHKTLRQGFFWPTLFADAKRIAARCEACQKIANNIRQPPKLLQSITSPWPFAMWGIDLIGPMPTATGGAKHAIVAVDYFTKWLEAEPLVHITEANTISFVKKNILYRFEVPNTIITDNGTQFDGRKFRELCDKYSINNYYASPAHPQTNGQTEAVNKIIKHNLKAKLATKKGSWADKLPQVL
ncbi:hypothetical protein LWI29_021826 [Acer saccharum]|uniref:Uncharacterized protein n=1 Tax=Acer saccharum TaxID=4024 RepID=A0AA39W3D7_ACESA|nr:hypothetical protein LWI29_021826 [Acer saccharum]